MRRRRRRRGTHDIRVLRARAGLEGTSSTSRFAIVERQHNSDHAQVARQLGQDSFLYQEGNQDQRREGERSEKKRLMLRNTAYKRGSPGPEQAPSK